MAFTSQNPVFDLPDVIQHMPRLAADEVTRRPAFSHRAAPVLRFHHAPRLPGFPEWLAGLPPGGAAAPRFWRSFPPRWRGSLSLRPTHVQDSIQLGPTPRGLGAAEIFPWRPRLQPPKALQQAFKIARRRSNSVSGRGVHHWLEPERGAAKIGRGVAFQSFDERRTPRHPQGP